MMRKMFKKEYSLYMLPLALCIILAVPQMSFAYAFDSFCGLVSFVLTTLRIIIPILSGIALLVFFWGIAQFILNASDTKQHAAGRQIMIWGIIGLFCLVASNGILQFFSDQFSFGRIHKPFLPTGGQNGCESVTSSLQPATNDSGDIVVP